MRRSVLFAASAFAGAFLAPALAAADGAVTAPAARGQQTLALKVDASGVAARVCAAPCTADGAPAIELPEDARPLAADGRARVVELADGRHVARVELRAKDQIYELIVAAPLAGKGSEPLV